MILYGPLKNLVILLIFIEIEYFIDFIIIDNIY